MNILRVLMLIGSLGKVWSRSHVARNTFSSISILAYFKMMNDFENQQKVYAQPTIEAPQQPRQQVPQTPRKKFTVRDHRRNVRDTMNSVNRIIYDK